MDKINTFILNNIEKHPNDIAKYVADVMNISVQAVNKRIKKLITQGFVSASGNTKSRKYILAEKVDFFSYDISGLEEDRVWVKDISKVFETLNENVRTIWEYAFSEIFNNAIEHSGGTSIQVRIGRDAVSSNMLIADNGIGIFKNIQQKFNLVNEHEAIFELSKGKLTTNKKSHSGEGIFFTSRTMDGFAIESHGIVFVHSSDFKDKMDKLYDSFTGVPQHDGTVVFMFLRNDTKRTLSGVFDEYADVDHGFDKTVIPIQLARYGDDNLISRSQARRVLNRVNLFKYAILDFDGVPHIGQAFADEIFRVFVKSHPNIKIDYQNAVPEVENMIKHVMVSNI